MLPTASSPSAFGTFPFVMCLSVSVEIGFTVFLPAFLCGIFEQHQDVDNNFLLSLFCARK
jgi:hypothetical protein